MPSECSVDYCTRPAYFSNNLCQNHLARKRRGASDWRVRSRYEMTPEERFWDKVDKSGPVVDSSDLLTSPTVVGTNCWVWTAAVNKQGYGRYQYEGKARPAHRLAYEWSGFVIPEGLYLDHLCRNPSCVNPDHLEPVTPLQNVRRGKRYPEKCHKGHDLQRRESGIRVCRTCINTRARERGFTSPWKGKDLDPGSEHHGTERGYTYYWCRCSDCKAAHAAHARCRRYLKKTGHQPTIDAIEEATK